MIRITGGEARGASLKVYQAGQVRPTTDKVRQAIFNVLEHRYALDLSGSRALDLFAGSGSLGLEFLSRGGELVSFVERDKRAVLVLRENVKSLSRSYDLGQGRVTQSTVERALRTSPERPYDVIFADPPYRDERGPALLDTLDARWLSPEGIIVIEHAKRDLFTPPERWTLDDRRKYGDTLVSFIRWAEVDSPLDEPVLDEPVLDEPVLDEPVLDEPVLDEPILDEPV